MNWKKKGKKKKKKDSKHIDSKQKHENLNKICILTFCWFKKKKKKILVNTKVLPGVSAK